MTRSASAIRGATRGRAGSRTLALCLVVIGVWLILIGAGLRIPRFDRVWPALPIGIGLAMLVETAFGGGRGLLFLGLIATLSGGFLLLFSTGAWGIGWPDMAALWPVLIVIVALVFLVLYLAGGMQEAGLLLPVALIGGAGILVLPFTVGVMTGPYLLQVLRFWPLLAGLAILALLFGHADRG
jgi:hypothetical protein